MFRSYIYTVVKVDGATPKSGLARGHDKPIHKSDTIYFPGGIFESLVADLCLKKQTCRENSMFYGLIIHSDGGISQPNNEGGLKI